MNIDALKQIHIFLVYRNVKFRPTSGGLHEIHALFPPVSLLESRDAARNRFACNWIV